MTDQTTILVKKSDGTTERITLAELKKRQSAGLGSASVTPPSSVNIQAEDQTLSLPPAAVEVPKKVELEPVLKIEQKKQTDQSVKPLKTEDVTPISHEDLLPQKDISPTAANRGDQVDRIISSLSFKVIDSAANRLRSCIQLRLKDIRSEVDTLDMCVRSIKDGGLGLTENQAKEVLLKSKPSPYIAPLSQVDQKNTDEEIKKQQAIDKIISPSAKMPDIAEMVKESVNKIAQNPLPKPNTNRSFHDVQAKPIAMGPIDEIEFFSLVDLRRLALSVPESIDRFKQKFLNLRAESFALFMDSWAAWRKSPLYMEYIEAVDASLSDKKHLSAILNSKEKISMLEIEGIIKMEQELDL